MCRGCRYDKCILMGMVYDGPMRKRKNTVQYRRFNYFMKLSRKQKIATARQSLRLKEKILCQIGQQENTSQFDELDTIEQLELTGRLLQNQYTTNCSASVYRRRIRELELVERLHLPRLPHSTEVCSIKQFKMSSLISSQEIYLTNFDSSIDTFTITVTESWQFYLAVFPTLSELTYEHQVCNFSRRH